MSRREGYRQPIIISCGAEFADPTNDELFDRHSRYGRAFRDLAGNPNAGLIVLVPSTEGLGSLIIQRESLKVFSLGKRVNALSIGTAAGKFAKKQNINPYWIAGTPFREATAARQARNWASGPLQIQAHGNFGEFSPIRGSLNNRLKWLMARHYLPYADSLRTVSPAQTSRIVKSFKVDRARIVCTPVPVNGAFFTGEKGQLSDDGFLRVGWFGRLHRERGFHEWIEITKKLESHFQALDIHIIGDGPHREEFETLVGEALPNATIRFHGRLSSDGLFDAVSQLDVVVNSFRHETYGRGIVESLLAGVKVIAIDSPGARHVSELLADNQLPASFLSELELGAEWMKFEANRDAVQALWFRIEEHNVHLLASSWLTADI